MYRWMVALFILTAFAPSLLAAQPQPRPDATEREVLALHREINEAMFRRDPEPLARAFHAPVAVMLVHSFCPNSSWREHFSAFCAELACKRVTDDLFEVPSVAGQRLLLGWCKGDACYLGVEIGRSKNSSKPTPLRGEA